MSDNIQQVNLDDEAVRKLIEENLSSMKPNDPSVALFEKLMELSSSGKVYNFNRIDEDTIYRSIVLDADGKEKPIGIEDGISYQEYNATTDEIYWGCGKPGSDFFLRQFYNTQLAYTGEDGKDYAGKVDFFFIRPDNLISVFGDEVSYVFHWVSSLDGNLKILNSDKDRYLKAQETIANILNGGHQAAQQLLITLLLRSPDNTPIDTWETATVVKDGDKFTWGSYTSVDKEGQFNEVIDEWALIWAKPEFRDEEDNVVDENILQIVARQFNAKSIPELSLGASAKIEVEEEVLPYVKAYLIAKFDGLTQTLRSIKLYKREDFDPKAAVM